MFERLREKAGYLDETICRIGDILLNKNSLADPQPVFQVMYIYAMGESIVS